MQAASDNKPTNLDNFKIIKGGAPAVQHKDFIFDQRLQINSRLQTTLEINRLFEIFYQEVNHVINIDGLAYNNAEMQTSIAMGQTKLHSCTYQLHTEDNYCGEICFYRSKRFSDADTYDFELLLGGLLFPLKNALLYLQVVKSAMTDYLTGAGNRAAMEKTLEREQELSRRNKQPLSVLMIDIDYFKNINDTFGHCAGDKILKKVVNQIEKIARTTDMIFRYGGEEFTLLLNNTTTDGALIIAERIREIIHSTLFEIANETITVTVSIGVTTRLECDDSESLIARADDHLYAAKQAGRDRVYCGDDNIRQQSA